MKKKLLVLFAMCGLSAGSAIAQTNPIPNGNFESWTAGTYEIPQNFVESSNDQVFAADLPFNVIKTTDKYHGTYAVRLTTTISNGDTAQGYFINTHTSSGNPATWHGGFPYSQTPTGIQGYYKSSIASPDSGLILAFFYKSGAMIGQYIIPFFGTHNTYTAFSYSLSPALPQAPDSIIFGAVSSDFRDNTINRNGSMLQLDYISFIGVASQPALFDGDFENWQSTTLNKPNNWFLQNSGNNATGGAYKTTDAYKGSYAIELTTYLGRQNNHSAAQPGQISTGWYPNCNSGCNEQGGYPFVHQTDTLAFYYKYTPSGVDTAQVNLNFKKNAVSVFGKSKNLVASATYQYVEVPFNVGQVPDSVMIDIQSSMWHDTLVSFVGSDLKIDNIHFKSQNTTHTQSFTACSVTVGTQTYTVAGTYTNTLTGMNNGADSVVTTHLTLPTSGCATAIDNISTAADVTIYPNPISTTATIEIGSPINLKGAELIILDVYGKTAKKISITSYSTTFDRSDLASGIYFYKLITADGVLKTGKLLVE